MVLTAQIQANQFHQSTVKESSLPKTTFNRRRVLVAAFVLALLAVAAAVVVLAGKPAAPVKATFVAFSKSTDDGAPLVVLRLTNESNRTFRLWSYDNMETLLSQFRYRSSTNEISLTKEDRSYYSLTSLQLLPFSGTTCQVRLPKDGRSGWPGVCCFIERTVAPGLRGKAQTLWWRLRPPRLEFTLAVCDREIQCPRMLPDGTIEPARLLSPIEPKR